MPPVNDNTKHANPAGRGLAVQITKSVAIGFAVLWVAFALARIVAPLCMDLHNTALFWVGVACWPVAALILLWAIIFSLADWRAFLSRRRQALKSKEH